MKKWAFCRGIFIMGKMVVDRDGFRLNVGLILASPKGEVFWGRRVGQEAWQFPQGGVNPHETLKETLYRELHEEVGLSREDVEVLACTKKWQRYHLPKQFIRRHSKPLVIGQRQKWFLLRLKSDEAKINLDASNSPEFDAWRWVDYWYALDEIIYFKRRIYQQALEELAPFLPTHQPQRDAK